MEARHASPSASRFAHPQLLESTLRLAQPARLGRPAAFPSVVRLLALTLFLLFAARLAVPLAEMVLAEMLPASAAEVSR